MAHIFVTYADADGQILSRQEYPIDTLDQIAVAEAAMREAGIAEADVYVGEGQDETKNGQRLIADP